jgi:hypothetical protein
MVMAQAPDDAGQILTVPDARVDVFISALADYRGAVSADDRSWSAIVTVEAANPGSAWQAAAEVIEAALTEARMPAWPLVRFWGVREDVRADQDFGQPPVRELGT